MQLVSNEITNHKQQLMHNIPLKLILISSLVILLPSLKEQSKPKIDRYKLNPAIKLAEPSEQMRFYHWI